jgi:hypothetical protein
MFRFSIRDVLWLTLVVALALGWWVRERKVRAEAERGSQLVTKWRMRAGALESALNDDGWDVTWDSPNSSDLVLKWPGEDVPTQVRESAKKGNVWRIVPPTEPSAE